MKKSVSFLVLCILLTSVLSLPATAQDMNKKEFSAKKTEVNIAVANIFAKNNLLYQYYYLDGDYLAYAYSDYYRQPELVLGLKFHGNKGAFRLGTNLRYSNITDEVKDGTTDKYSFKNTVTALYLGYEWHSVFDRVNVFYGFDVSTSYSYSYFMHEYTSSYPYGINKSETKINETTIGVNPLVGVNVFITPHLSVGTEVKFTAEYISGKSEYIITSNYPSNEERKSSGFRTRFGPIGFLSINIHF